MNSNTRDWARRRKNQKARTLGYRTLRAPILVPVVLFASVAMQDARAADAPAAADADAGLIGPLTEVIITGTRKVGMQASDSPAPVQVLAVDTLEKTGAQDLVNQIAMMIPSFNADQTGGDMESQTLVARLRGLSPNHVLVLVNGKRRHVTANVAVDAGPSVGAQSADLSFIPTAAIDHVEVLTDGAAAQYGSDAIAGVINIILKKNYSGGSLNAFAGAYKDGGGNTEDWSGNAGIGDENRWLNVSAEVLNQATVLRAGPYGSAYCIEHNTIPYCVSTGAIGSATNAAGQNLDAIGMQEAPGYPYLNPWGAPPEVHKQIGFYNAGWELGGGVELYSFGNFGDKQANSFENYRKPTQGGGYTDSTTGETEYMYPLGFTPREASGEMDYSVALGLKGETGGWNWDISSVYGKDKMNVSTLDTMNFTLYANTGNSPSNFFDGTFTASQETTDIDVTRNVNVGFATPATLALGLEQRHDMYQIGAGDPASYYGVGASSFPGYSPQQAGQYTRENFAAYVDLALAPVTPWQIDLAGRFEHYSDFGSKTVGKFTTRYDINPQIAVRGTASTGFRAPTLGEEHYQAVNVAPTSASPVLAAEGTGASALGFGTLKPETSTNFSLGLVMHAIPRLTTTLDAYQIEIKNRITQAGLSYSCSGTSIPHPCSLTGVEEDNGAYNAALGEALVGAGYIGSPTDPTAAGGSLDPSARANISVATFTNAFTTITRGVDLVNTYPMSFDHLSIDWMLSGNYNKTEVLNVANAPSVLTGGAAVPLISATGISAYTTGSPLYRLNLGALFTLGEFSLNVLEQLYGSSYTLNNDYYGVYNYGIYKQGVGTQWLTNLELAYLPSKSLRFSVGANNVLNTYPPMVDAKEYAAGAAQGYSTETLYQNTPYGFFGAFYYAKVQYSF